MSAVINGKTVVMQFSTTANSIHNWASAVIRRMTHSPFSHCDIVLPDGNMLGASDSPDSIYITGNPRGVAVRPPNYQEFGTRRRMLLQTAKAEAILSTAMSQLGKPFDHEALHDFISDDFPGVRNWRDTGKWYCAEHIVWSIESAGYWEPRQLLWPKNRVSPTDIFLVFMFDPNWINRDTFWDPVPGLALGPQEK